MKTQQVVSTPPELIQAVEKRFGKIAWDLAANQENSKAQDWYGPGSAHGEDSLSEDWSKLDGLLWLNPPFSDIAPWASKCAFEGHRGARIAMLALASIGTSWYLDSVEPYSCIIPLAPRLTFEKHTTPYPKDLFLCLYGPWVSRGWQKQWRWK